MSICNGINEIIDNHLEVEDIGRSPHFAHKTSCLRLSKGPPAGVDVGQMISEMLACLEKNWGKSPRRKYADPSNENWRFKKQLHISSKNTSPEKLVEKGIIHISSKNLVNQVPTASGLWDHKSDRHRNVDLVHRLGPKEFEFIELKIESDTPLKASMEILLYGILYIFSRRLYDESVKQNKELLQAEKVHLRVLAPLSYYAPYDIAWLEMAIDSGLRSFLSTLDNVGFDMDFLFEAFPENFDTQKKPSKWLDEFYQKSPIWGNEFKTK